jgi:spermidine synthase
MSKPTAVVPAWKRWLSYFFEFHLESAPSEYNPHLYVSLKDGRYQMSTAHAVYSHEDLYTNFYKAFQQIALPASGEEEVLVLGLGLGSIPFMLERHFSQQYQYTLVEIDENVIALAEKYCLRYLESPITTVQADAYGFVMQNQQQYELICMDIFLDDVIPGQFESVEFLEALSERLSPGGTLLYNRLYRQADDKTKTESFFNNEFRSVFPNAQSLEIDGNWILLNELKTSY